MLCAQSCERPLEDVGQPLLIAGVENMAPLVAAMTREWEIATHNAALLAMGHAAIPPPRPPPGAPNGDAAAFEPADAKSGNAAVDAAMENGVPASEDVNVGDVVMGEAEVVDLVPIEEKPSEPKR